MGATIRLLGRPTIADASGKTREVRGFKAWGLLARILLARRPLERSMLSAELFADAEDPLGSLRWCLASLRGAIGAADCLKGDPIVANLPNDATIDVWRLEREDFTVEEAGPLLDGVEPKGGAEFSTWLLIERERLGSLVHARLRQETLRAIATANHQRAIALAEHGVRRAPLDEGFHILLAKSLAQAGQAEAALKHVESTEKLFIEEVGEPPSPALRSAARATVSSPPAGIPRSTYVTSMIDSGLAALAAGAADAGVDCLRRAIHEATGLSDPHLLALAQLELGTALVHFSRGYIDEGAITLGEATELARRRGYGPIAAQALRELGFVEMKAGRRPMAAAHFSQALGFCEDDDARARVRAFTGQNLIDWGRIDEGLDLLVASADHARASGNRRHEIWSLTFAARGLVAADRASEADAWLDRCLALIAEERWIAFRPWPVAIRAESALRQGRDAADQRPALEEAFALSNHLADACWEAATARVIGLTHAVERRLDLAATWLADARRRLTRESNTYAALHVQTLANQAEISAAQGRADLADAFAREWLSLAARTHMDAHIARAAAFVTGAASGPVPRSRADSAPATAEGRV